VNARLSGLSATKSANSGWPLVRFLEFLACGSQIVSPVIKLISVDVVDRFVASQDDASASGDSLC